jgi:hypothetical protein
VTPLCSGNARWKLTAQLPARPDASRSEHTMTTNTTNVVEQGSAIETDSWVSDPSACELAARRMYDAEVALHYARQSNVDAWVEAAYGRLHDAIVAHSRALIA